jgi:hypothetical protein
MEAIPEVVISVVGVMWAAAVILVAVISGAVILVVAVRTSAPPRTLAALANSAVADRILVALGISAVAGCILAALGISLAAERILAALGISLAAGRILAALGISLVAGHILATLAASRRRTSRLISGALIISPTDRMPSADRIGILPCAAVISAAFGPGPEGFIISTTDGGMRPRGGLKATAATITGPMCALPAGVIQHTGTTAACVVTAIEARSEVWSVGPDGVEGIVRGVAHSSSAE